MTEKNSLPLLRTLRTTHNLTQEQVATHIGVSRVSYIALEKGSRALLFTEAEAIAKLYNITLDQLAENSQYNLEKYQAMIRFALRAAAKEKYVLKKTKLSQLLYLADMRHYYQHDRSISNIPYRKCLFGPAIDSYLSIIEELELTGVIEITQVLRDDYHMYEIRESKTSQKQPLTLVAAAEAKTINAIVEAWGAASTNSVTHFIEAQLPYRETALLQCIPYERIKEEEAYRVS